MRALSEACTITFVLCICYLHHGVHSDNGVDQTYRQRSRGASQRNRRLSRQPELDSNLFTRTSKTNPWPASDQVETTRTTRIFGSKNSGKSNGKASSSDSSMSSKGKGGSKSSKSGSSMGKGKGSSMEKGKSGTIFQMKSRPKEESKKEKKGGKAQKKKKRSSTSKKHDDSRDHASSDQPNKMGTEKSKSRYSEKESSERYTRHPAAPTHPTVPSPTQAVAPTVNPKPSPTQSPMTPPSEPASPDTPATAAPTPTPEVLPLSPLTLEYFFEFDRRPLDPEVNAAVSVTRTYLNGFTRQRVSSLQELQIELDGTNFVRSFPFMVNYTAVALIKGGMDSPPTAEEIDLLLSLAFSGDNLQTYIGLLRQLPETNIFSTTTDVFETAPKGGRLPGPNPRTGATPGSGGPSMIAIGASAGAGVFIALLLGIGICRRRERYDEVEKAEALADGHVTVAGETYLGNSTMYSASEVNNLDRPRFPDDNQSEWALSTRAITEDGSESVDQSIRHFEAGPLENQLNECIEYEPSDPLQPMTMPLEPMNMEEYDEYHSDNEGSHYTAPSSCGQSEDESVPMRVVDLIKRFSPL